jgi:hypothetical protein
MYLRVRAENEVVDDVGGMSSSSENSVSFELFRVNRYLKELSVVYISPSGILIDKKRKSVRRRVSKKRLCFGQHFCSKLWYFLQQPKISWSEVSRVIAGDKPKVVIFELDDGHSVNFEAETEAISSETHFLEDSNIS